VAWLWFKRIEKMGVKVGAYTWIEYFLIQESSEK